MLAAFVSTPAPKDPLSVLEVAERPEPEVLDGWTTVQVRAVSLNHHDLFSLRGIGLPQERMPMILGTDAAGLHDPGAGRQRRRRDGADPAGQRGGLPGVGHRAQRGEADGGPRARRRG